MSERDVDLDELAGRLDDPGLTIVDVRTPAEYDGSRGHDCDPRQGHIRGAQHLEVRALLGCADAAAVRELVGLPQGAEIVAYCHSGSRSAMAVDILRGAGYDARNYRGSWHEWSRTDLPAER